MPEEMGMPRASWRGFLRLSLVSCPVYLSPATTRLKPTRLHQVWRSASSDDTDQTGRRRTRAAAADMLAAAGGGADEEAAVRRITIRPHDPESGEEIDKSEILKGYEFERGHFVTFTKEELKALDVESSKVIDLERFVPRGDIDPVYLDAPYYLYPDGAIAADTIRVIGAAMAEIGVIGIGPLTLSRRERAVMVEPRGSGMALFTLRAAEEVRPAQFDPAEREVDAEMVAIAGAIIRQRLGPFDPGAFHDRYQEALRALIGAKLKGVPIKPKTVPEPAPVVDLMTALKRSVAREAEAANPRQTAGRQSKTVERRQPALLLPLSGSQNPRRGSASAPAATPAKRRKNA
jgi:DNA end-binding protein Ku